MGKVVISDSNFRPAHIYVDGLYMDIMPWNFLTLMYYLEE